jgi:RNA polymerase sigma-70 factor (ECF subfamily)
VSRYERRVYSLARRLTGTAADAEDVLQETFVRVHGKLASFRGESALATWIFRVATNCARMARRKERRRRTEPLDDYLPKFDRDGRHAGEIDYRRLARADEILDRRRLATAVRRAIDRLPETYRVPLVLRDLEELPTREVGRILGLDEAAVRQRVHRGRLMMRGYLSHLVGAKA